MGTLGFTIYEPNLGLAAQVKHRFLATEAQSTLRQNDEVEARACQRNDEWRGGEPGGCRLQVAGCWLLVAGWLEGGVVATSCRHPNMDGLTGFD